MRSAPKVLALAALVLGSTSLQAAPEAWNQLRDSLQPGTTEARRVELTRAAWADLGPRGRMRTIELLAEDPGDTTEQFLVERLEAEPNAFLRRRLALVLGRFATRKDTLATLEKLAEADRTTALDSGSCWRGEGHAREQASIAAGRVRERREQVLELGDDTSITGGSVQGLSWFGVSP